MSMEKAGSRWSSPVQGLSLRDGGFQGVSPEDTAQVMANSQGATGRASAAVWGLTGPISLPSQKPSPSCAASATFHVAFHPAGSTLPTAPAAAAPCQPWCKYATLSGSRVHQPGQHPKGVQGCPGWGRAWTGTPRVLPAGPSTGTLMPWLMPASTLFFSPTAWSPGKG